MARLTILLLLLPLFCVTHAQQDNSTQEDAECLVDKKMGIGMASEANMDQRVKQIQIGGNYQDDCISACCDDIKECNVAVFERTSDNRYVCTLLKCDPFDSCEFEPKISSFVAEMETVKTQAMEELNEIANEEETVDNSTGPVAALNQTENILDLLTQEEEELEEKFDQDFGKDQWNIDYNTTDTDTGLPLEEDTTTTAVWADEDWQQDWNNWVDDNGDGNQGNNETWDDDFDNIKNQENQEENNYWDDWVEDTTDSSSESSSSSSNEDESSSSSVSNSNEWEDPSNDGTNMDGANRVHNNNGIYGPRPIEDTNAAPFIVMGVVASVLFILMVLVFVGRKLGREHERLKYRPLNESFPSNSAYHDDNQYAHYHDIPN